MNCTQYASNHKNSHNYHFGHQYIDQTTSPKCLDAYRLAVMISLPDIRESKGCVAQGYIRLFHVREDARFKEEGVGMKSEP